MINILITFACCILGPQLLSAREYLVIDVDSLQQLQHNKDTVPARRHTVNKNEVVKTKNFLKSAIKTLKSYKDVELQNVIKTFKDTLTKMNVKDKAFRKAKKFVLDNMLSPTTGKSGKEIKKLLDKMYQALENDEYKHVLDKNPAIYQQIMSQLIKSKEKNRTKALRSNTGILDIIKSGLQQFVTYFMFNPNKSPENSVVRFAKRVFQSDINAENDDYLNGDGDPAREKKQPLEWFRNNIVNLAFNLFNNTKKPTVRGQINLQIDGLGGDTGLKMSFGE